MPTPPASIRLERPGDPESIHAVHAAAFPTDAEARLVDSLRARGELRLSLVATCDDAVVGHIAFSPVTLDGADRGGVGLAPVAVLPEQQSKGLGAALVTAGLGECRAAGAGFAVVLGEPGYYRRFGFRPASDFGLSSVYDAGDAFMAIELRAQALAGVAGLVRYGAAFDAL
ncbi:hypothetical protein KOR34_39780 [Posidoniimonas corsicana]|uniref:N-acetyltransferase domain-containing protein n=1 Tax=Posidoniimonas corsicana TaxID=1938618 RepID=A0A5C5V0Z6_9BACT|nr:N-acetyltransferase [Posidoniimonas corsicana]TWT32216.1 hypothetical protein KOR34_39780 [Posidoniimonas corsicana]